MKKEFIIYALIGISGVGKTHLVNYALNHSHSNLKKLIAITTREKRETEKNGIDKFFLTKENFIKYKEDFVLVRTMYGALYGFRKTDFELKSNLIVELYFKDYLKMRKKGYPVKGIYVWTLKKNQRRTFIRNRYTEQIIFIKREIEDVKNNLIHKILFKLKMFDHDICNQYDTISEEKILRIVENRKK